MKKGDYRTILLNLEKRVLLYGGKKKKKNEDSLIIRNEEELWNEMILLYMFLK